MQVLEQFGGNGFAIVAFAILSDAYDGFGIEMLLQKPAGFNCPLMLLFGTGRFGQRKAFFQLIGNVCACVGAEAFHQPEGMGVVIFGRVLD